MSVLTVYVAAVARWYRRNDLVIPFISLGRPHHPGMENTVGYFGVPLFLRIVLRDEDRLLDLLQRVTQEYSTASEHHDYCRIMAQVPGPSFTSNPSFNWLAGELNLRPIENIVVSEGEELNVQPYPFEIVNRDAFIWDGELRMDLSDGPAGIGGTLIYNADRLTREAIESFKDYLFLFAEQLVKNSRASVVQPPQAVVGSN